jgi:hypothetical protein
MPCTFLSRMHCENYLPTAHSGLVINETIESGFHIRNRGATPNETGMGSWSAEAQETDEGDKKQGWVEKT